MRSPMGRQSQNQMLGVVAPSHVRFVQHRVVVEAQT
jgi:hypothetical protein